MLKDEQFSSKAKVDRYGRRLKDQDGGKKGKSVDKHLQRLYRVEGEEEEGSSEEEDVLDADEDVERELKRVAGDHDPARDGGFSESSSSEESSSEEDSDLEEEEVVQFPDARAENIPEGEVSSRVALVNLDWDNIRASDLMAVLSSFAPKSERILKVSIYPSEFGKERMDREEMEGPPKEIFASLKKDANLDREDEDSEAEDSDEENEKIKKSIIKEDTGEDFSSTELRRYQLERLRYYYAIVICSSKECAKALYNSIDGTEYAFTANQFDCRYVPDDLDFSDDKPRDECEKLPDKYRPNNDFVTSALRHSKVKLTWDAEDSNRKEVQKRAFTGSRADIEANDLKAYLASDSSSDEEEVSVVEEDSEQAPKLSGKEQARQRTRAALGLQAEPAPAKSRKSKEEPTGEMQITFTSGFSGSKGGSVFENQPETEETTREKYVRKEKERKVRRKEKSKAVRNGETWEEQPDKTPHNDEEEDLGLDDPFFMDPEATIKAAASARKNAKRVKGAEAAAEEAHESAKRAELELLMVDDDGGKTSKNGMEHFDLTAISKGAKALKRKSKHKHSKLTEGEKAAIEAKQRDTFKMNVQDPRFSAVYDANEYAIDPSNPRFKATEGMEALLEEGRLKRSRKKIEDDDGGRVDKKKKRVKVGTKV